MMAIARNLMLMVRRAANYRQRKHTLATPMKGRTPFYPFTRSLLIAPVVLILLSRTSPLLAQPEKEKPTKTAFAKFVPATTKLFVELRRAGEVDRVLRDAEVSRLWSLATSLPDEPKKPSDVRSALTAFLATDPAVSADELMKFEMGLTASSWSDLGSAVWFVRIPDNRLLDRWFPPNRRQETAGTAGDHLFRMTDGMMVAVRGGIVAMTRGGDDAVLVRDSFRLMLGGGGDSLQDSTSYRQLAGYMPGKLIALVYWAEGDQESQSQPMAASVLPKLARALVGVAASADKVDFAVRAALAAPEQHKKLGSPAVDRLLQMPATTLFAFTTTIDVNSSALTTTGQASMGWPSALSLLTGLPPADIAATLESVQPGPHFILAWDQDLSAGGSALQASLQVESKDAQRLAAEFEAKLDALVSDNAHGESPDGPGAKPAISRDSHFGLPIGTVKLNPASNSAPLLFSQEARELAWTVHGDWFMVAFSRDHLTRMLDAQFGFVPTLSSIPDVQSLRKRPSGHTSIMLFQPDLASDTIQRWFAADSLSANHDPSLPTEPAKTTPAEYGRLGIAMFVEQEPGTVVVARIYEDTAADGRLFPDDRIIGVDDRLLKMESPNTDLRRLWEEPSPAGGHTLRVQRENTTLEVFLKHDEPRPASNDLLARAAPALREFAAVVRNIRFASVTVHPTDERHWSALLSMRLSSPPTTARR